MTRATRVRYTRQEDGTLLSKQMLSTTLGDVVTVQVVPTTLTGNLLNGTNQVLLTVEGKSLHEVKKKLKTALKNNGVNFLDELRTKRTENETTTTSLAS